MTFIQTFTKWFVDKKKLWQLLGSGVLIFAIGFGNGYLFGSGQKIASKRLNYTTSAATGKGTAEPKPSTTTTQTEIKKTVTPTKDGFCYIKGNIASGGKKTYHMPGGSFYNRTTPEQCFSTEAEAKAAGFTKSSR